MENSAFVFFLYFPFVCVCVRVLTGFFIYLLMYDLSWIGPGICPGWKNFSNSLHFILQGQEEEKNNSHVTKKTDGQISLYNNGVTIWQG